MADFRGYVTAAGQQFEALAKQMNYPVTIGFVEIGDGRLPDDQSPIARTKLVNKLKEFPALVEQDPKNPGQFVVTCYIPADDSINGNGYFIREMGCRLIGQGAGILYSYRRVSDDWKPVISSGEAKSYIYKLRFIPTYGELITPTIDPSIVLVDKEELESRFKKHAEEQEPHKQYAKKTSVLDKDKNGEDIPDKPMFLRNLGLTSGIIPVGIPLPWPMANAPIGWLKCNGASFDKTRYPKLAIAYPSGVLPDLRGEFIRGWDDGRGVNQGRGLLSSESHSIASHNHALPTKSGMPETILPPGIGMVISEETIFNKPSSVGCDNWASGDVVTYKSGGLNGTGIASSSLDLISETKPRNVAFNYIVEGA